MEDGPVMTRTALKLIVEATNGPCLVQWFPSQRVEQIQVVGSEMYGVPLGGGRRPILLTREKFWCRVLGRKDLLSVGDLQRSLT